MKERKRKDFVLHDKSLSHTNIDIILETKLEALANTRVFTYRIPEKRTVAEYGLLCSPTNPDVETKNIVLLNALDLNTFIFPNLINTVITNAINDAGRLYDSTKDPLTNLSFIIPISYAIGNWAVAYLSSLGGGAGYSLIYINSITNAGKETRNTDYKLIYDILSKLGIAKDEDLSCNQQNYSKDGKSSLWPSGHILIDNIERLCTKRPIIKANFCTDLIKKELLDDSTTTLKVAIAP